MRRRRRNAVLAASALALVLSACGGSSEPDVLAGDPGRPPGPEDCNHPDGRYLYRGTYDSWFFQAVRDTGIGTWFELTPEGLEAGELWGSRETMVILPPQSIVPLAGGSVARPILVDDLAQARWAFERGYRVWSSTIDEPSVHDVSDVETAFTDGDELELLVAPFVVGVDGEQLVSLDPCYQNVEQLNAEAADAGVSPRQYLEDRIAGVPLDGAGAGDSPPTTVAVSRPPDTSWEAQDPSDRAYGDPDPAAAAARAEIVPVPLTVDDRLAATMAAALDGRPDASSGLAVCSRTPVARGDCSPLDLVEVCTGEGPSQVCERRLNEVSTLVHPGHVTTLLLRVGPNDPSAALHEIGTLDAVPGDGTDLVVVGPEGLSTDAVRALDVQPEQWRVEHRSAG